MSPQKKNKQEETKKVPLLTIENAKIIYRNFAGAAKKFNAAGLRNFHVVIDNDLAVTLEKDGWNIKWHDPKEDGDQPWASIKVSVRFDNYPPRVLLITEGGRTLLDQESIEILDWAEIDVADVILSPSYWEVQGKTGIKAYLKKGFFTLSKDDLESKYSGSIGKKIRNSLEEDED